MLRGATGLDSLYQTLRENEPVAEKKKKKEGFIRKIILATDTLLLHQPKPSRRWASRLPNNTYFMSFRHYQGKLNTFQLEMNTRFPGDLKGYLRYLAKKYPL
jgi:hypothetical protein